MLWFGLLAAPAFGQIANVQVGNITSTQAVISYRAPDMNVCAVEVSQSPGYRPLIHDVNPALFSGADQDDRAGNSSLGVQRRFVAGKRVVEYAVDGKRYSRALGAALTHSFRITCGASIATGTFQTTTLAAGSTYAPPLPADPLRAGETAWPTLFYAGPASKVSTNGTAVTRTAGDLFDTSWKSGDEYYVNEARYLISSVTDTGTLVLQATAGVQSNVMAYYSARNYRYYDPETGAEYRLMGIPRDIRPSATAQTAFDSAAGTNWTNPSGAIGQDASNATYSGTTQDWLYLKHYQADPANNYFPDFFNAVNFRAQASAASEPVQLCITTDVNASGVWVCDSTQAMVELALSTSMTAYVACKDAPCTVTRIPGDFLGAGADVIPAARMKHGENKVAVTSSSGVITFSTAAECNRMVASQDVLTINVAKRTVTSLNCGSNQVTVSPVLNVTGSYPYLYNTGMFANPRFGLLIRKKATGNSNTITIDDVKFELGTSFRFVGTSGGLHSVCSPALSSNGFYRCDMNPVGTFAIKPDGSEIRTLGYMSFFGQTYGLESGQQTCNSFGGGQKLWDPTDPNLFYCAVNDAGGRLVLTKMTLNGNDAHVNATEAAPLPLISLSGVVNLTATGTPGTIKEQIAAWDPTMDLTFWNCSLDVITGTTTTYMVVPCRRGIPSGQDSISMTAIFQLNAGKTTATLVALNKHWQNTASRWCTNHTTTNLGHQPALMSMGLQYMHSPSSGPGFGPYEVTLQNAITTTGQTTIDVTSDWKSTAQTPIFGGTVSSTGTALTGSGTSFAWELQKGHVVTAGGQVRTIATVTGNTTATVTAAFSPDISGQTWTYTWGATPTGYSVGDPLSIYPDRYITSAAVDDVLQIGSEYVRITAKNTASQWVVARGVGWGGVGSSTPSTYSAATTLTTLCSSGPSSLQSGTQNKWFEVFWDFVGSPDGSSTTYYKGIYTVAGGHGFNVQYGANGLQFNDNFGVNGSLLDRANWGKTPNDFSLAINPNFAGKIAPGQGNSYQGHPSSYLPLAPRIEQYRLYDVRPMIGSFSAPNTSAMCQSCGAYTLTGDLWRYTYGDAGGLDPDGLSFKQFAQFGVVGDKVLRDISGPGSVITGGTSDAFKMCIAQQVNECVTGSAVGEVFMNAPGLEPLKTYCTGGEIGTGARDACVADMTMGAQSVIQLTVPSLSNQAAIFTDNAIPAARVLGRMFNYWRQTFQTGNVKLTPGGEYLLHGGGGHDKGSFLIRVPPHEVDSVARNTFVPIRVQIGSAPSGTARAMAQFGYAENGPAGAAYCTSRQEACFAVAASVNEASPFKWAFELSAADGVTCATGCSVAIPAIPGRMVYYRLLFKDAAGVTLAAGPLEMAAAR
jgi:hypothetical protein